MPVEVYGNANTVRLREQGEILVPKDITLDGSVLSWDVGFTGYGRGLDRKCFRFAPSEGLLKAFSVLADAEDARVLDFAQSWGILGVSPHITCLAWDVAGGTFTLRYRESVAVYRHLASMAQTIQKVFQSVRRGKPAKMDDIQKLPMGRLLFLPGGKFGDRTLPPHDAYTVLLAQAAEWSRAACSRLVLSGLATAPFPGERPSLLRKGLLELKLEPNHAPGFVLDWGDWHDGVEWDVRQAGHLDRAGWHGKAVLEPEIEVLTQHLPLPDQRPSALFNALAFHLMQSLVFPVETYWCYYKECGKPYTLEELYQRERASPLKKDKKGNVIPVRFPCAPRADTGGPCSPECRTAQRQKTWRESKQKNSTKTQEKAGAI